MNVTRGGFGRVAELPPKIKRKSSAVRRKMSPLKSNLVGGKTAPGGKMDSRKQIKEFSQTISSLFNFQAKIMWS